MKYEFTNKFKNILLEKLRVYHRHYHKYHDPKITLKEYVKNIPVKKISMPNHSNLFGGWIEIKIDKAWFVIKDDARTLATVYRNANQRDCRC